MFFPVPPSATSLTKVSPSINVYRLGATAAPDCEREIGVAKKSRTKMKKKAAIHSRRPLLIARARLVQLDLVKAKVAGESDKGTSKPSCVCIFPSPRKGRTHLQCTVFFQERDEKCFFQGKSQCSLGKGVTPPGI